MRKFGRFVRNLLTSAGYTLLSCVIGCLMAGLLIGFCYLMGNLASRAFGLVTQPLAQQSFVEIGGKITAGGIFLVAIGLILYGILWSLWQWIKKEWRDA